MADKAINELVEASQVTPKDLFVLQQDNTAKKLSGQTLINYLLRLIDGHGGIQSVAKVSTSGLKDAYRFTFADQTTFDFVVTNGRAITSVKQTKVNGLTRTYTISFNDATSETFTVKDGRAISSVRETSEDGLTRTYVIEFNDGTSENFDVADGRGITKIEKTATNILTDTYTISYNDGTADSFTVKNGRGIKSFGKVSSDGLVDTYRMEYTDGTSDEFTVTNGAKGDKGDNTYTWIKYAAQEPTEESHSFGSLPDNWIGIYFGPLAEAPTDWKEYAWYQIKGEPGDTGDPAVLLSSSVSYQVGDSGTIIPSGSWNNSIPVVAQGKYLWTRTTNNFNTGSPVVSYSVSRMGLDGSGSVSSVANISPDENGNVPMTASDVGALPNTGGDLTGELKMNGQPITGLNMPTANDHAANMGFVNHQMRKASPWNLLINSNFRDPVNTNGKTKYNGTVHSIDRWRAYHADTIHEVITGSGIKVSSSGSNFNIYQVLDVKRIDITKVMTAVGCDADDHKYFWSGIPSENISGNACVYKSGSNYVFRLSSNSTRTWKWAALYYGEYTADTLPEYQPKGYEYELMICRQYDSITGAYLGLREFGQPRNLLINSNFTNPVNERGKSSYTGSVYTIDRWRAYHADTMHEVINGSGIKVSSTGATANIYQALNADEIDTSRVMTAVCCDINDNIYIWSGVPSSDSYNPVCVYFVGTTPVFRISSGNTTNVWKWAALYYGVYTADTLPEYQARWYSEELAECRRYYQKFKGDPMAVGYIGSTATNIYAICPGYRDMRKLPKLPANSNPAIDIVVDGTYYKCTVTTAEFSNTASKLVVEYSGDVPNTKRPCIIYSVDGIELDAELT